MYLKYKYFNGLGLSVLFYLSLMNAAYAAPKVLSPVDEAPRQSEFLKVRNQLKVAVAKKDVATLLKFLNKDIKNEFSENNGIENFKKIWKLSKPATSPLWKELSTVLALGGSFYGNNSFAAPYVYSKWPEGLDPFDNVAVIGKNVNVRVAPKLNSAVLAKVSYQLLPLAAGNAPPPYNWHRVKLTTGKVGYIASQYVRSSANYRAIFEKINGRWQMNAFVNGD